MKVEFQMGIYSDDANLYQPFQSTLFKNLEEAITTIDFIRLRYDSLKNNEGLVVRFDDQSKTFLLDRNSNLAMVDFKNQLEKKFNNYKLSNHEKEETPNLWTPPLNSNFQFEEDQSTHFAKTTTNEPLPFKLYRPEYIEKRSNLLWEHGNSGESSDFALIERRFIQNSFFSFQGRQKLYNYNDIAWLFKSLEDEAVEHAFLVYHFNDKGYFVQHISSGSITGAIVDNRLFIPNIIEVNPEAITFVHNHPSGNLKVSTADVKCMVKIKNALLGTDIQVNDGIIINLKSGQYLIFDDTHYSEKKDYSPISKVAHEVSPYSFSKHILAKNYQPHTLNSPEKIAAYLTNQKFGVSDKTELLVVNNALQITGKFLLPQEDQADFIIKKIAKFGGTGAFLYGNNITPEEVNYYNKKLQRVDMSIIDALRFKSENGEKIYNSLRNEGLINITKTTSNAFSKTGEVEYDYHTSKNKFNNPLNQSKMKTHEKQTPNQADSQQEQPVNQLNYLANQLKYLGFPLSEKELKELKKKVDSDKKQFSMELTSDRTSFKNKINYLLNFNRSDQGLVFFNSYQAVLTKANGQELSHAFAVNKKNTITAKEALNLLEGRAVKTVLTNKETGEISSAFIKLKIKDEKTDYGNFKMDVYHKNYGVNTKEILKSAPLIFDNKEYRDNAIKSLEKGNIVKVKFAHEGKLIHGKAVLNPQYKSINLYDSYMNRLNTNKSSLNISGEKEKGSSRVKQHNISRSL